MTRDQIITYARQILVHVVPEHQTRGFGTLDEWEHQVPTALLSEKTRAALNVQAGMQISLEEIRSWCPGMQLGSRYTQGPGKDDQNWKIKLSWPKFNRALVEIFCVMYGRQIQPHFQDETPRKLQKNQPKEAVIKPTIPSVSKPTTSYRGDTLPLTLSTSPPLPLSNSPPLPLSTSPTISTGSGALSVCLSPWAKDYPNLSLSAIPTDKSHPPRLQVFIIFGYVINDDYVSFC